MRNPWIRGRALLLIVLLAGSGWPVAWLTLPAATASAGGLDAALAAVLAWVLLGCWAWIALTCSLLALEALLTGGLELSRGLARLAPRLLRTAVASACGVGVVAGLAGPAAAADLTVLDGLRVPDRQAGAVHLVAVPAPPPEGSPRARQVTVRPGDTLWQLGHRHHVPWQRLYHANRAVVGDDPDLIRPGVKLVLPSAADQGSAEGAGSR